MSDGGCELAHNSLLAAWYPVNEIFNNYARNTSFLKASGKGFEFSFGVEFSSLFRIDFYDFIIEIVDSEMIRDCFR